MRLGIVKKIKKAKVAVFTCGLGLSQTETKGTVLIKNKDEMLNFTTGEEKHMEKVRTSMIQHWTASLPHYFLDLPRDRRLRSQSHHRRIDH